MSFRANRIIQKRNGSPKILIVRNDGLGDFILTLPLIASIKKQIPQARIHVLIRKAVHSLISILPDIEGAVIDEGVLLKRDRKKYSKEERKILFSELLFEIKAHSFDIAVLPYAESASAALIRKAGIPVRIGSGRRLFLYNYNVWNFNSRRKSAHSEFTQNLRYLANLGLRIHYTFPAVSVRTQIVAPKKKPESKIAVLHVIKRNDTALSWPIRYFATLSEYLIQKKYNIILIGDRDDHNELSKFKKQLELKNEKKIKKDSIKIMTDLNLGSLAEQMSKASLFVGNSSGPLHLAGLVQIPHIGLFPQNTVSSPERWRTLKFSPSPRYHREYLLASNYEKRCVRCEKEKCKFFNCMESIGMERVKSAIQKWETC